MIATLTKALSEGKLEDKLKTFTVPRLLVVDEIGYLILPATFGHGFRLQTSPRMSPG